MIESFWQQHSGHVAKQYLGTIRSAVQQGPGQFMLADINSKLQVTVLSPHIMRLRLAPGGTFLPDFSYALAEFDFPPTEVSFDFQQEHIAIATPELQLQVRRDNFLCTFADGQGNLLNQDLNSLHWEENVEYGGYYVFASKYIRPHENFYGLGDKAADLNLIRKSFTLWSTDAYAFDWGTDPLYRNIPFYIGLCDGVAYGIFYDNTYRTYFDFGKENPNELRYVAEGGELNYYFIAGPSILQVIQRYHQLTGTPPMPPLWALGFHQCRWSYYPDTKLLELAREFRERQIPCDALYLDIDYMEGYRCFTWSKEKFPDPAGLTRQLSEQGFKTVVIVDPGIKVDPDYWVYNEGAQQGYFCRRGDDYEMEGPVWPGRCRFPDFTNPRVRAWWGQQFRHLLDAGVEGIWTDMNEPSVFGLGTFPHDVRHHYEGYRGSHRKAHNVYGMQMARATYDGLRDLQKNKRPFLITRSCYSGVQRYASCWTGDNKGTWAHLRLANVQAQRMAMSGISFVGSDIGGFIENADAELFIRWVQLAVFHPLMRAHSSGDTREREPWSYGPEAEAILKKFIELRYRLLPYLYTSFWQNHRYHLPMLRPIIALEQQVNLNIPRQDEFALGDHLLVCPVLDPGVAQRTLYLPQGQWYNWWTNQVLPGGQEHTVPCPLDSMPIFVRAGAVVPEYAVQQHIVPNSQKELILNVYYSTQPVHSLVYEDHGETFAYEQEIFLERNFVVEGTAECLVITQEAVGMYTPRYDNFRMRLHGLPYKPRAIKADGRSIQDFYQISGNLYLEFLVTKSVMKIEVFS